MTDTAKMRPVPMVENHHPPEERKSRIPEWVMWFVSSVVSASVGLVLLSVVLYGQLVPALERAHAAVDEAQKELVSLREEISSLHHLIDNNSVEKTVLLKMMVLNPDVRVEFAREVASSVYSHSIRFGRSPDLTLAIIKVESNFNRKAVSGAGALGLMQVMPKWKNILGLKGDLTDTDTNIHHGLQILGFYQETHNGNLRLALASYNRGPAMVRKDLMAGRDPHQNGYAKKVLEVYNKMKTL